MQIISSTPQGGTQAQLRFLVCSKMAALETNLWISSRAFCFTLHSYDPLGYKGMQATIMAMGLNTLPVLPGEEWFAHLVA